MLKTLMAFFNFTVYLEISKSHFFAKTLDGAKSLEGPLFIWIYEDGKRKKVAHVGTSYNNPSVPEAKTVKTKVFYENESSLMSDNEKAAASLKFVIMSLIDSTKFIKPLVIINSYEALNTDEQTKLKEVAMLAGARKVVIKNEKRRFSDQELISFK